jgi:hypothetical protein
MRSQAACSQAARSEQKGACEMNCKERMEAYLNENGVPFEVKRHNTAYTMPEVAAALHE